MAMSYTELIGAKTAEGSIKYYVRHSEVPSTKILESAQSLIYGMLRVREMKALATGTIALDATTLTLPTGFMDPISLWLSGENKTKVRILDEAHFEERVTHSDNTTLYPGTPSECTMDGTLAYFNVKAEAAYGYRLWYWKTPTALGVSNETNFLTVRYPHILEAACKYYAYTHREDEVNAPKWLTIATAAIEKANGEYDMYQQSIQTEMYWNQ